MSEPQGYDDEVLPSQTADDTDRGWGEDGRDIGDAADSEYGRDIGDAADSEYGRDIGDAADSEDADLERLRREKPPHW